MYVLTIRWQDFQDPIKSNRVVYNISHILHCVFVYSLWLFNDAVHVSDYTEFCRRRISDI